MQHNVIDTFSAVSASPSFTVSRASILPILDIMARKIIERRNTIPILSNVVIEASPSGELRLTGTDLDLQFSATLSGEIEQPGATTVSAATLRDIVKKSPKGAQIRMKVLADEPSPFNSQKPQARLQICYGKITQYIACLPIDDFPMIEMQSESIAFIAPDSMIAELPMIAPFAMKDGSKYWLQGVALDVVGDAIYCVASDNACQAQASYPLPDGAESLATSTIPSKAIALIQNVAKMTGEYAPIMEISGRHIRVDLGAMVIVSKLIDGEFPAWQNATPSGELSGLLLPELEPRLASGKVEALNKAVGLPLSWSMGDVGGDERAVITCESKPNWQAVLCTTSTPVYPQGYFADGECTVQSDGATYPVAVKSGRIHLSKETVHALCGDDLFDVIEITLPADCAPGQTDRRGYVSKWLYDSGDSKFLTVPADGKVYGEKTAHLRHPVTRAYVDACLSGEVTATPISEAETVVPVSGELAHKDDGGFGKRVDYAASVISTRRETSRAFDSCFENYDGDAVVYALIQRAKKNDKIAANLPHYIAASSLAELAGRFDGMNLVDVARGMRSKAMQNTKETVAVVSAELETPPIGVQCEDDRGFFIVEQATDKAIAHYPDHASAYAAHNKMECKPSFPNAVWPLIWRYMICAAVGLNDCRADLIAKTAQYFADIAALSGDSEIAPPVSGEFEPSCRELPNGDYQTSDKDGNIWLHKPDGSQELVHDESGDAMVKAVTFGKMMRDSADAFAAEFLSPANAPLDNDADDPADNVAQEAEALSCEPEIAPIEAITAQPDAMAALIARIETLEAALLISATTIEAAKIIAPPSGAIEKLEPLPIDPRMLSIARAKQEIAAETPLSVQSKPKRTAAHIRAIMAYLGLRRERVRHSHTDDRCQMYMEMANDLGLEAHNIKIERDQWRASAEKSAADYLDMQKQRDDAQGEVQRMEAFTENETLRADQNASLITKRNKQRRRSVTTAHSFREKANALRNRALAAENALSAVKARSNGWPPAVRSLNVNLKVA